MVGCLDEMLLTLRAANNADNLPTEPHCPQMTSLIAHSARNTVVFARLHSETRKHSLEVSPTTLTTFYTTGWLLVFTVSNAGLFFSHGAVTGFSNFTFTFQYIDCICTEERIFSSCHREL